MQVRLRTLVLVAALGIVASAQALTNESATILWAPTIDPEIKYELRWRNLKTSGAWTGIASGVDSSVGKYVHVWNKFPDTTGDRTACWDIRAVWQGVASPWLSDLGRQVCMPVPNGIVVVPNPPPLPGLVVVSETPMQVVVSAKVLDCPRITTSTKGSTSVTLKRTITCVK